MQWLACLLVLCVGCGSATGPAAEVIDPIQLPDIPAKYVSDTTVIPKELVGTYEQQINATPLIDDFNEDQVKSLPLLTRRARVYLQYPHTSPNSSAALTISLHTFTGVANQYDGVVQEICAAAGYEIIYADYFDKLSWHPFYHHSRYTIRSRRALSVGEAAWIADWIITHYGDSIQNAYPWGEPEGTDTSQT